MTICAAAALLSTVGAGATIAQAEEAANLDIEVPAQVTCYVRAEGSVVAPDGWEIRSATPVYIESASAEGFPDNVSRSLTCEDGSARADGAGRRRSPRLRSSRAGTSPTTS